MIPIHRIEVPNPFFEGSNSVYLLMGEPLTLIDTGVATSDVYAHLKKGLRAHAIEVRDIERVILTHKHIDHIGNAWRIQQESNATVYIHHQECKSLTDVDPSGQRFGELVRKRLAAWGLPSEGLPPLNASEMPTWELEPCTVAPLPASLPLHANGSDYDLGIIETPGHTLGSVCLQLQDQLFTGDHILERISPNIGAGDLRSRGMLGHFLNSLQRVRRLGDLQIHPGHGASFRGLSQRCNKLQKHHQIRLTQALRAVRRGKKTVWEVARALYGKLRGFHILLGCAEANAHLEYLEDEGQIYLTADGFWLAHENGDGTT